MGNKLDLNKKIQTRDGRDVRILCTDMKAEHPIVALILHIDGEEIIEIYCNDGHYYLDKEEDYRDLINVNEKKIGWVIIGQNHNMLGEIFKTKEDAEHMFNSYNKQYSGISKIEWKE
jgi:hypothetical protein